MPGPGASGILHVGPWSWSAGVVRLGDDRLGRLGLGLVGLVGLVVLVFVVLVFVVLFVFTLSCCLPRPGSPRDATTPLIREVCRSGGLA
jgi:hypothetical protein